jgi:hypothetical protein
MEDGSKKRTVIVVPTLLGEMQLPLYLRGDGKVRAFGELQEQKKLPHLPPNMTVLWECEIVLGSCQRCSYIISYK